MTRLSGIGMEVPQFLPDAADDAWRLADGALEQVTHLVDDVTLKAARAAEEIGVPAIGWLHAPANQQLHALVEVANEAETKVAGLMRSAPHTAEELVQATSNIVKAAKDGVVLEGRFAKALKIGMVGAKLLEVPAMLVEGIFVWQGDTLAPGFEFRKDPKTGAAMTVEVRPPIFQPSERDSLAQPMLPRFYDSPVAAASVKRVGLGGFVWGVIRANQHIKQQIKDECAMQLQGLPATKEGVAQRIAELREDIQLHQASRDSLLGRPGTDGAPHHLEMVNDILKGKHAELAVEMFREQAYALQDTLSSTDLSPAQRLEVRQQVNRLHQQAAQGDIELELARLEHLESSCLGGLANQQQSREERSETNGMLRAVQQSKARLREPVSIDRQTTLRARASELKDMIDNAQEFRVENHVPSPEDFQADTALLRNRLELARVNEQLLEQELQAPAVETWPASQWRAAARDSVTGVSGQRLLDDAF